MGNGLIALVAVIYTGVAISYFLKGDTSSIGMGICFIGYVIGNIGLIMANYGS